MEQAIPDYNFVLPDKVERAFDNDEVFNVLPKDYSKIKNFVLQNATK